jgi:hypothetical protein
MINTEIIFCPNFEGKYGRLVKEIWSDFSVLLRKFPGFLLLGPWAFDWNSAVLRQNSGFY